MFARFILPFFCAAWVTLPLAGLASESSSEFFIDTDMLQLHDPSSRTLRAWQRNSNSAIAIAAENSAEALSLSLPDRKLQRAAHFAIVNGAGLWVNHAFSLTAHDLGHMERAESIGATDVRLIRSDSGREISVYRFFMESFISTLPALYTYKIDSLSAKDEAAVAGQGLNVNLQIAAAEADAINVGKGTLSSFAPYMMNKTWGLSYFLALNSPTSDATTYIDAQLRQGHNSVTRRRIIHLQALCFAASGGTIAIASGTARWIASGDAGVQPLTLQIANHQIHWPELSAWLNDDCVSLEASTDARFTSGIRIMAAADTPVLGNRSYPPEISIGGEYRVHSVTPLAMITTDFGGVPFFSAGIRIDIDTMEFGIRGHYGRGSTRREVREHPYGNGGTVHAGMRF